MAGGRRVRLPAEGHGVKIPVRAAERAVVQRRPVPGNSPSDRKDYPDFKSPQESLRRCPPARPMTRTVVRRECALLGERNFAFFRHDGIYRSDGVAKTKSNLGEGAASRWSAPSPSPGRDERNYAPYSLASSAMSSGRLFLDRVARQHCPSPLHRHPQNNTHSSGTPAKGDISTLPARGHFYFALTPARTSCQRQIEMSSSLPSRNVLF